MTARTRWARVLIAFAVVPALAVSACGSDDPAPQPSPSSTSVSTSPTSSSQVVVPPETTSSAPVSSEPPPVTETTPAAPVVDPLTGGEVSPNVLVAAKIDNTFSGDQWGVGSADVVYVEMVEGQLSRLIALFHTTLPDEIGPVRSVRTTDPDVLTAYGTPALIFSGGAGGPLDNFASSGLIDASEDAIGSAFWRSSAAKTPYNLHANAAEVASTLSGIGVPTSPGFTFGADYPALAGQRDVGTVSARFENALSFEFTDGVWNYIRRGSVQSDGADGADFAFDNLLVQHTTAQPDGTVDVNGVQSYKTNTIGNGAVTLYRDGKAIDGTWTRADATSPTVYADAGGAPLLFKPGKTWVVLAPEQVPTSEG